MTPDDDTPAPEAEEPTTAVAEPEAVSEPAESPPEPESEPEAVAEAAPEADDYQPDEEPAAEAEPASAAETPAAPEAPAAPAVPDSPRKWYVIKVVSGREESIKAAIERKIKIEGLEQFFGQIVIPVERVTEVRKVKETKNGEKITKEKRVVKSKKKFPGYLMAEVEFNDQILYVFRETNGVGDFVGAAGPGKPPPPMSDRDVQAMLHGMSPDDPKGAKLPGGRKPKVKIDLEKGDKVRIRDGAFAGMEGEVKEITEAKDDADTPKMSVEVSIFGRPVKIDNLEYWQIDKV